MELTWPIKIRIGIAAAVGIGLLGIFGLPLVSPADPMGVVSVVSGRISGGDAMALMCLAFVSGIVSYFLAWPMGKQIGIFAAPAGLAFLATRSCDMGTLFQGNASIVRREQILSMMCWEGLLWLAVVAAGFLGVFIASHIIHPARPATEDKSSAQKGKSVKRDAGYFLNIILAIAGSVVAAQFFIGIFARDFTIVDANSGRVIGQPAMGQIVFALLMSFGLAGFLVKVFLKSDYISVIISTGLVSAFSIMVYSRPDVISYFAGRWPAAFFPNATLAVLPIQAVSFGTIGAIAGYWTAIRFEYWHKNGI